MIDLWRLLWVVNGLLHRKPVDTWRRENIYDIQIEFFTFNPSSIRRIMCGVLHFWLVQRLSL